MGMDMYLNLEGPPRFSEWTCISMTICSQETPTVAVKTTDGPFPLATLTAIAEVRITESQVPVSLRARSWTARARRPRSRPGGVHWSALTVSRTGAGHPETGGDHQGLLDMTGDQPVVRRERPPGGTDANGVPNQRGRDGRDRMPFAG